MTRLQRAPQFIWFLLLGWLFLWPVLFHPNFILLRPDSLSDLLLTHLPNAVYIRESLVRYHQVPLWNGQIMGGQPFAADPLSGLWYPPNLALLVLPLPFGFNLLFALHLAWAGYGLFRFLRAESASLHASFFGGLAFAGTPKLIAHLGAGHVSLVFAVAWTPWLLLAARQAAHEGGIKRGALAGAALAMVFLADVRWTFYAGLLAGALWLCRSLWPMDCRPSARRVVQAASTAIVISLMFTAILSLPLVEFIRYSSRGALSLQDAAIYSLPLYPYLLGLIIPIPGVLHEWVTYIGIVPLALAAYGAIRHRAWFWVVSIAVAVAFSLGSNFILFPALFRLLPGIGFLRVPARAWFVVALGGCVLAGGGLDALLTPRLLPARYRLLSQLMAAHHIVAPAVMLVTIIDLLQLSNTFLVARPLPDPLPVSRWIEMQPGLFRVYSPSASLPLPDSLQHVEGVNPLHLSAYEEFVARASGIPVGGYSVSVPFFFVAEPDAEPARAKIASSPDPQLLGMLNVKYVAVEFPINVPGLLPIRTFGRTYLYENVVVRPRVWIDSGSADVNEWTPNRLVIRARGAGLLVVSEIMYPGWVAHVDGAPKHVEAVGGLLRGVRLEGGQHYVTMEFRPISVYIGMSITIIALSLLAAIWRWAQ